MCFDLVSFVMELPSTHTRSLENMKETNLTFGEERTLEASRCESCRALLCEGVAPLGCLLLANLAFLVVCGLKAEVLQMQKY